MQAVYNLFGNESLDILHYVFSVAIHLDDYEIAENVLNSMSATDWVEEDYLYTQRIYLESLLNPQREVDASEISALFEIGTRFHKYSGYAASLYVDLSGEYFYERPSDEISLRSDNTVIDSENIDEMNLYPNPSSTELVVTTSDQNISAMINIFDSQMNMVKSVNLFSSSQTTFDVTDFEVGIYFIELIDSDTNRRIDIEKFIKIKK